MYVSRARPPPSAPSRTPTATADRAPPSARRPSALPDRLDAAALRAEVAVLVAVAPTTPAAAAAGGGRRRHTRGRRSKPRRCVAEAGGRLAACGASEKVAPGERSLPPTRVVGRSPSSSSASGSSIARRVNLATTRKRRGVPVSSRRERAGVLALDERLLYSLVTTPDPAPSRSSARTARPRPPRAASPPLAVERAVDALHLAGPRSRGRSWWRPACARSCSSVSGGGHSFGRCGRSSASALFALRRRRRRGARGTSCTTRRRRGCAAPCPAAATGCATRAPPPCRGSRRAGRRRRRGPPPSRGGASARGRGAGPRGGSAAPRAA